MSTSSISATQVESSLTRKLEDLTNELAYIQHFPERFSAIERLSRKVAVLAKIKEVRWLIQHWAMPVEEVHAQICGNH